MSPSRLLLLFPVLAGVLSISAWLMPEPWVAAKAAIVPLLGLVMLVMGTSLRVQDFVALSRKGGALSLGLILQFSVMPALAVGISEITGLDPLLTSGLVLVGVCPGGTASNVVCFLAGGNVALSVSLTALSTLAAVVLTPALSVVCLGADIDVPALAMLKTLLFVVALPVCAGIALAYFLRTGIARIATLLPAISVTAIAVIIAIIIALNRDSFGALASSLILAVVAHNLCGFLIAWLLSRRLLADQGDVRAVTIEVGMQNSGLAVALALKHFTIAAALPGAVFSLWHNLSGVALAWVLRQQDADKIHK